MKRKMLLSVLAVVPAVLMPFAALGQLAKEKAPAETNEPTYKYEAYVGWGYTSLNQVNQSESGLQGVSASFTRDWGKYFGITAEGGHYAWTVTRANPEKASVDLFLAGPVLHANLYGNASLFVHGLVGVAHTGGVSIQPDESLAGGAGIGVDYKLTPHFGLRAYGDDIASSFTVVPYESGDSAHMRWNARGSIGVTFKF